MNTKHFAVSLFGDHFDESAMGAQDRSLTVSSKWKLSRFHRISRVARLLFRQPNRADLRLAIRSVGNARPHNLRRRLARNVRYREDAFHHRRVRELRQARNDVADGV